MRLAVLQNRLDTSSSMVIVNSALYITIDISILFVQLEFELTIAHRFSVR